jgi:hypothetical protein
MRRFADILIGQPARGVSRLLVALTTLAALIVVALIVVPSRAHGEVSRRARVARDDVFAFSHDAIIDHAIAGDVVVMNGSATIDQPVNGDVVVLGGSVTMRGNAHIFGDLACLGGTVTGAEKRVDGDLFAPGTLNRALASAVPGVHQQRLFMVLMIAIKLTLLLVWLVVTVLVTLAVPREVRQSSIEVRSSPLHTFAVGLAGFASIILTAIILSSLIPFMVGIPLLIVLTVFAIFAKVFGTIAVFHAVGTLIAGARTREELASRRFLRGDLAMTMVGLLVLGAIRMIPVVGTIVWGIASLVGVGTALATAFGRREPWFLALRAVES